MLSSNLIQKNDDDEEIFGFTTEDIKSEMKRASKLACFYCKERGASIGCCNKACRKSFHLPCALKENCLLEFDDEYRSFCHIHAPEIAEQNAIHDEEELCGMCGEIIGIFNCTKSIKYNCCDSVWHHKQCVVKAAYTMGREFACPYCDSKDIFRKQMLLNGVFIPNK